MRQPCQLLDHAEDSFHYDANANTDGTDDAKTAETASNGFAFHGGEVEMVVAS